MKPDLQDQKRLELLVDRLCRQQPLRRAPADLHERVMRQVQLRKVLPWWRQSFMNWPLMLQVAFVATALVTAKLALSVSDWVSSFWVASASAATQSSSLVRDANTLFVVGNKVSAHVASAVPMSWFYVAIAVTAAIYLVLFGIGFTTYRTLYATRQVAG